MWGVVCLCESFIIIIYIKSAKTLNKVLKTLWYAIEMNYEFIFVIFISYIILGIIGLWIFGGVVNSQTPMLFSQFVGVDLTHNLELINFNDLGSAMIALYSVNMGNRFSELVHMFMVSLAQYSEYSKLLTGIYFFVFYILSRLLLFT